MMGFLGIFWVIILAALLGGGSIGCLGTYIVGMRIPFIGIVMSHTAMLGAVLAYLLGWPQFPVALGVSLAASLILGLFSTRGWRGSESNTHMSILFSLMIGLTFLGMGMIKEDMTPVLGLMWGSLLFVTSGDLVVMTAMALLLFAFGILFHKELKAILFSRTLASVSGIPVKMIYCLFLILTAALVTANLNIVGGLLIYSLLTCPAAAAYELGGSLRQALILSCLFGIISAAGGLLISFLADLPTGACITLTSVALFGAAHFTRRLRPAQ